MGLNIANHKSMLHEMFTTLSAVNNFLTFQSKIRSRKKNIKAFLKNVNTHFCIE